MQDLLAFNCLTWLFVNENPVVNYSVENMMVSRAWVVHIPVCACEDGSSWFQLTSYLKSVVFVDTEGTDPRVKRKPKLSLLWNIDVSFKWMQICSLEIMIST